MITLVLLCSMQTAQLPALPGMGNSIPVLVHWTGEIKIEKRSEVPETGYLVNKTALDRLWSSWRPAERAPEVDFTQCVVLVDANRDLNRMSVTVHLSEKGDLNTSVMTTLIGYTKIEACTYQISIVRREGIKTVKGKPLLPSR